MCDGTHDTTGNGPYYWDFDYDAIGNITQVTDKTGASDVTYDYTYGASQGTYDALPHAVTTYDPSDTSATTYSYDKNGNQTGRASHDLTWDPNSRLVEYDNGSEVTEYVYDTEGRRVIRIDDAAGTPTVTYYIGGYEIEDPGGTETESTYYMFAGTQVAVRVDDGTTDTRHYLISDHLGSNAVSVEYETTTKNRTFYQPYGDVRATTGGGVDTDHTYTGQIHDGTATGLMYYNARYYDPALRRFISSDSMVPDPANPQDHNRYTYVRNNPLKYTDPTGHCSAPALFANEIYPDPCKSGGWSVAQTWAALVTEFVAIRDFLIESGWRPDYSEELGYTLLSNDLNAVTHYEMQLHDAYNRLAGGLRLSQQAYDNTYDGGFGDPLADYGSFVAGDLTLGAAVVCLSGVGAGLCLGALGVGLTARSMTYLVDGGPGRGAEVIIADLAWTVLTAGLGGSLVVAGAPVAGRFFTSLATLGGLAWRHTIPSRLNGGIDPVTGFQGAVSVAENGTPLVAL